MKREKGVLPLIVFNICSEEEDFCDSFKTTPDM